MMPFRVGTGFDVHRLQEGLPLVIGGVSIPHTHGAVGHSDADVLLHAISDALLGAAGLGDIGLHFPDTDSAYKGIDSRILLARVGNLLRDEGYQIGNIDSTVCMQQPRLRPHIPAMEHAIAETLEIPVRSVSVKATTTERLGFEGRGEGVSAQAIALIYSQ